MPSQISHLHFESLEDILPPSLLAFSEGPHQSPHQFFQPLCLPIAQEPRITMDFSLHPSIAVFVSLPHEKKRIPNFTDICFIVIVILASVGNVYMYICRYVCIVCCVCMYVWS